MAYYEFLRVRNVLKNLAIVLIAIFLLAAGLRVLHASGTVEIGDDDLKSGGTTRVTHVVLPNGSTQTTIDDPKKSVHVVVVQPNRSATVDLESASAGVDVSVFFSLAIMIALIAASIFAGVFANQNRNHLEIAFMWPQPRERTALSAIAIDVAAIVASLAMGALTAVAITALFVHISPLWSADSASIIALAIVAPIAWYGLLLAASASLRSFAAVVGIGWAVGLILPGVAAIQAENLGGTVALVLGILRVLARLDPIAYLRFGSDGPHGGIAGSPQLALAFVIPLAVIYLAAAVLQWRRVEA